MATESEQPLRLSSVEVQGLFGRYDHRFELASAERVTILHGPNGVGKTAVLRILYSLFSGRFFELLNIRFSLLRLGFIDGEVLEIERRTTEEVEPNERLRVHSQGRLGLQEEETLLIDKRAFNRFATMMTRRTPWIERVGVEEWRDRRTNETLTTTELLLNIDLEEIDRASQVGLGDQVAPIVRTQALLRSVAQRVDVHIIETQRLLRTTKKREKKYYSRSELDAADSEVRTSVSECSEEVRSRIAHTLSRYATVSQMRDQSFPMRLLASRMRRPMGTDLTELKLKLRTRLKAITDKRSQLADVGLLIDRPEESRAESLEALDLDSAGEVELRVIELYAEDTTKKLENLDDVLKAATLMLDVLNRRFRHKRLKLDRERGLVALTEEGGTLKLDGLSSGEQHQLVMFFDLLFKVRPGTLVLIDEPELSLHVSWQKALLDDLLAIAHESDLDVLLATHSPYVAAGRLDLMRELVSGDDIDESVEV